MRSPVSPLPASPELSLPGARGETDGEGAGQAPSPFRRPLTRREGAYSPESGGTGAAPTGRGQLGAGDGAVRMEEGGSRLTRRNL